MGGTTSDVFTNPAYVMRRLTAQVAYFSGVVWCLGNIVCKWCGVVSSVVLCGLV